ncbi:MAG: hypothetical protein KIT58_01900 [Planctomycetota bacterium]|nr:hypothetical protein [Planctomycetota bacterium]
MPPRACCRPDRGAAAGGAAAGALAGLALAAARVVGQPRAALVGAGALAAVAGGAAARLDAPGALLGLPPAPSSWPLPVARMGARVAVPALVLGGRRWRRRRSRRR